MILAQATFLNKRRIESLLIVFIIISVSYACRKEFSYEKPPLGSFTSTQRSTLYGGSKDDGFNAVVATPDGGYILAGYTQSNDGDLTGTLADLTRNDQDIWILKINSNNDIVWQKRIGGTNTDEAKALAIGKNGFLYVTGLMNTDVWIAKLDTKDGTLISSKTIGGSQSEVGNAIAIASNDSIYIAGYTNSNNRDISNNLGQLSGLIIKLDANLNFDKNKDIKCFTRTSFDLDGANYDREGWDKDWFNAITISIDGKNIYAAGATYVKHPDVIGTNIPPNGWIVKMNTDLSYDRTNDQKYFGRNNWCEFFDIQQHENGDIYIVGKNTSSSGYADGWIIKENKDLSLKDEKYFGATNTNNTFHAISILSNGTIYLAGRSSAASPGNYGYIMGHHGSNDAWATQLNPILTIENMKCFGGSQSESFNGLAINNNGTVLFAGSTYSNEGETTSNHGGSDGWVIKL